jgi:hypothetical protein
MLAASDFSVVFPSAELGTWSRDKEFPLGGPNSTTGELPEPGNFLEAGCEKCGMRKSGMRKSRMRKVLEIKARANKCDSTRSGRGRGLRLRTVMRISANAREFCYLFVTPPHFAILNYRYCGDFTTPTRK